MNATNTPLTLDDVLESRQRCEQFAEILFQEIENDENPYHHIGRSTINAYRKGDCEAMLIALCGWSMQTLLEKLTEQENDQEE